MIWRCRLDSSTTSKSMMPSVPDARRRQVHQRGRAQAAGADAQHLGVLQPLLPGHAHVGDDQVARVTADLVDGQLGGRLDQRWQRHGSSPETAGPGSVHPALTTEPGPAFPPRAGTVPCEDRAGVRTAEMSLAAGTTTAMPAHLRHLNPVPPPLKAAEPHVRRRAPRRRTASPPAVTRSPPPGGPFPTPTPRRPRRRGPGGARVPGSNRLAPARRGFPCPRRGCIHRGYLAEPVRAGSQRDAGGIAAYKPARTLDDRAGTQADQPTRPDAGIPVGPGGSGGSGGSGFRRAVPPGQPRLASPGCGASSSPRLPRVSWR